MQSAAFLICSFPSGKSTTSDTVRTSAWLLCSKRKGQVALGRMQFVPKQCMPFWTSTDHEVPNVNNVHNKLSKQDSMCFLLAFGLFVLPVVACRKQVERKPAEIAIPVSYLSAQVSDIALSNQWVATLDGNVNAQIQPQVSGYLVQQKYREGSSVRKGEVLFQIDPRPFDATLHQAQGQLGQVKSQLLQAEAQLSLAELNVKRDTPLAQQHAIAQSQLDNELAQLAAQRANVEAARAAIQSAEAQVESAQLNLGFTQVRSLVNGVAGQAMVQMGNLVSPQSVLTTVSQLDPIRAYFSMSDSEYLALSKQARKGDLLQDRVSIPLLLTLADGQQYPVKGKIQFLDRQIDQQTGAIRVVATFPNPSHLLRPGQFGKVSAETQVMHHVILVPQTAVMDLQGLKQVYTIDANNRVHVVNVTLGAQSGKNWIVTEGLAPNTLVIMDQLQKLREGMLVKPTKISNVDSPATR